ncbi:MAG: DUF983 domain-containing protein [Sphingomonas sp.]
MTGAAPEPSAPEPLKAALQGLCPRCGSKTLFVGVATFAPACATCGLDYAQFNVGDGPAAFLTLILGAIIVTAALAVELNFHPPFWVHLILWIPITAVAVIWSLRIAKAALLSLEFRNAAREGRIDRGGE